VVAVLKQVPNEKMVFKDDPKRKNRSANAILAYSWRHFLDDPTKPEFLIMLPMVKATVKAMDAVTDFVRKTVGKHVSNFCIGGHSKASLLTLLISNYSICLKKQEIIKAKSFY